MSILQSKTVLCPKLRKWSRMELSLDMNCINYDGCMRPHLDYIAVTVRIFIYNIDEAFCIVLCRINAGQMFDRMSEFINFIPHGPECQ